MILFSLSLSDWIQLGWTEVTPTHLSYGLELKKPPIDLHVHIEM